MSNLSLNPKHLLSIVGEGVEGERKRGSMKRFLILLVFLPFTFNLILYSHSFSASKKALLIGINNYKNLPFYSKELGRWMKNLKGPLNDIRVMKEALISRYDFRNEDIKTLTESDATRDNIIRTFEDWFIKGTKEGDLVFFYFSGHGTQVDDQNGDEDDGKDEALCPYDVVPRGAKNVVEAKLIIDDELGEMLRKLPKRDVIIVVDSCHSGSMTRNIRGVPISYFEETPASQARFIHIQLDEIHVRGKTFSLDIPKQSDIPEGQIFISSAREDQISLEIALHEGFHGAMTSGLVEGMKGRKGSTYRELFEYAKKVVKDRHRLEQDPQIEPEKSKLVQNLAFSLTYTIVAQAKPEEQKTPEPSKPTIVAPSKPPSQPPSKPPEKPNPPQVVKTQESPPPKPPQTVLTTQTTSSSAPFPNPPVIPQPPPEIKEEKVLVKIDSFPGGDAGFVRDLKEKLKRLQYVEITEETFFDRLIRGKMKNGECHAKVLNRIGDVVRIPQVKNIDELIKAMAPHLEYAYIVKQLAHIQHPDPPFKVNISVAGDRRDFRIGEKIVYNVFSEEDCYILMLNLDSKGNFHIIYPNKYHQENFVKAGEKIQIPDQEMRKRKFEFQFFPPTGEETVKVIATNTQLNLEGLNLSEFREIFKSISGSPMEKSSPSRGLVKDIIAVLKEKSKDKEFRWSEDTVVVRSH
jgi:hypothetical protein